MGIRWLYALPAAAVVACAPSGMTGASFRIQGGSWDRTETDYGASYKYTAFVLGQGVAEHGVWLVAVAVIRDAYGDPSKAPDTTVYLAHVADGSGRLGLSDYVSKCTTYTHTECVEHPQMPRTRLQVRAFLRMQDAGGSADSQQRR